MKPLFDQLKPHLPFIHVYNLQHLFDPPFAFYLYYEQTGYRQRTDLVIYRPDQTGHQIRNCNYSIRTMLNCVLCLTSMNALVKGLCLCLSHQG